MKKKIIIGLLIALGLGGIITLGIFLSSRTRLSPLYNEDQSSSSTTIQDPYPPRGQNPFPDDADRDGFTDAEEAAQGTSSTEVDTDKDGLSDSLEIQVLMTNPTVADTDGDGYMDGEELLSGYNPAGPGRRTQ